MFGGLLGARRAAPERIEPQFQASSPENPSTNLADPASWFYDWASGGRAASFGPVVNEHTAMACSAVYRCVSLLCGLIASLPLNVYQRGEDINTCDSEAPDHPLASFFSVAPFPGQPMTSFTWREGWAIGELLWGNHYSAQRYNGAGKTIGFESAIPQHVEVYRVEGRNKYRFFWPYGCSTNLSPGSIEWLDQDDVIHIPGLGFNGITGVSRIRANARDAVALSMMLLEQIGRVHENSARPSGFVEVPPNITADGFKRMVSEFNQTNTGRHNAGKVMFGDAGSKFTAFQMSPEDLQTINLMRFSVADVSRFFGVPLHLLNETDKSTSWGTGLSEQTLAFLIYTLEPDLKRIEAELNYKLFVKPDLGAGRVITLKPGDYYVRFDRDELMAMDPAKAVDVAAKEIGIGGLLMNEYRKKRNRPPHEFGDEPLINSTNIPLKKVFAPEAQPRQDPLQADPLAPKPDVGQPEPDGGQAGSGTN